MGDYALMSKTDPHMSGFATKYYKNIKPEGNDIIKATISGLYNDCTATLYQIIETHIKPKYSSDVFNNITHNFVDSDNLHGFTFTKTDCIKIGLYTSDVPPNIPTDFPK